MVLEALGRARLAVTITLFIILKSLRVDSNIPSKKW